ncbi:hypothetical protein Ahy_B08g092209 [Arachis hypogaea]|uniref:Aminotransferase-like plant mobile domain-containing protein n=1 Tax=Arachis hypogaea TaxID=3818 RepID=A0A444Y3G0_ARAHY|nr:hypothetical protein Ahy_B08g092209 [Arachis hypogaea]
MFNVYTRLMPQHVMELYAAVGDVVVGCGPSPSTPEVVPLKVTPIHYAQPHDSADEDDSEGDSTYVAGSGSSSDTASEDEYVLETPSGGVGRFLLPPCLAIPQLSDVPSHYQTLNLDAVQPENLLNAGDGEDYNTDVVSIEWGHFVDPMYTMASIFNVYDREFLLIPDEKMWPPWYGTWLKPNQAIRRKTSKRPVYTRIQNEMDVNERVERVTPDVGVPMHPSQIHNDACSLGFRVLDSKVLRDPNGVHSHIHKDGTPWEDGMAEDE